jgi:hypothetical protein
MWRNLPQGGTEHDTTFAAFACLVAIALYCAADATAAEPRIGRFTKYDTGDFVIITSRSSAQAREIMGQARQIPRLPREAARQARREERHRHVHRRS